MLKKNQRIFVSSDIAHPQTLFNSLLKYGQFANNEYVYWDEFAFSCDKKKEYDGILVLNTPFKKIEINANPNKVLALMMEPGIKYFHPWMFRKLNQYSIIKSPLQSSNNINPSHGYLGWFFSEHWTQLSHAPIPPKNKLISCISSNKLIFKGHKKRFHFVNWLNSKMPELSLFGQNINPLQNKMDGLADYKFSIAIENTSQCNYFTEKINDCFLTYTIPLYYGCTNLEKYFPEKSFIRINIDNYTEAINTIHNAVTTVNWEERLPAIMEARNLVLNKYHILAGAAAAFREVADSGERKKIKILPVKRNLYEKIITKFGY